MRAKSRSGLALAVTWTLGAAILAAPAPARACEDDQPVACSLEPRCTDKDKSLCESIIDAFCAEDSRRCLDRQTLTMDPRHCLALLKKIDQARQGKKKGKK